MRLKLLLLLGFTASASLPAAVITVTTVNNDNPGPGTSLRQALTVAQTGDTIAFNIPGAGPHVIVTPLGGYPLLSNNNITINGYTQPGATPNTNPILGGNNAQIKIVLDSTGADTAPNPGNAARPLRRSSRLDFPLESGNTGYGESENCILGVFEADNVMIRGLSFIARRTPGSEADPSIYAVALIKAASNARIQGCWFGLAPGGSTMADVKPPASAVAAFRWRIGGDVYSSGAIVGTDGDGISDRAEFNVIVGGRIALALELPQARVSGNYVNVFPDGLHFVDLDANYALWREAFSNGGSNPNGVTIENLENGRVTDDTVIGTDGDGVSDSDERNVFAHPVYDHEIEFYSAAPRAVVAGNYFGVGVDGVTASPLSTNKAPDFIELPGTASIRVGSNGDGVSDAVEGNVIHGGPGSDYVVANSGVPIVTRGNLLANNAYLGLPFAEGQEGRTYGGYYFGAMVDTSMALPVLTEYKNGVLKGTFALPSATFPHTSIDLYVVDPAGLDKQPVLIHPTRWLGSFTDNGPDDLNVIPGEFAINLGGLGLANTSSVSIAVSYSMDAGIFNAGRSVTSPLSIPLAARPRLRYTRIDASTIELWWIAPESLFFLEVNDSLDPFRWVEVLGAPTYLGGRNSVGTGIDPSQAETYYRLNSL
jgi:hypothetical protein